MDIWKVGRTVMAINFSLRVLVVDDVPAMRRIMSDMLEEAGFKRIVEAEDGDMAWREIQSSAVDPETAFGLIVADWNMPGLSGVDLLRSIRSYKLTRDLSFLMVTAKGDQAHIDEALRAGVNHYIIKPFDGTNLIQRIGELFP